MARADEAFDARQWQRARVLYEQLLDQDSENGRAWYRMGLCAYMSEDFEQAVPAFERAAAHDYFPTGSRYNVACAYGRLGDESSAFEWLTRALETGYMHVGDIAEDTDLALLRDHEGFENLITWKPYQPHPRAQPVQFETDDGVTVFGELYPSAQDQPLAETPMILMFHQAGSNTAEYGPIAPRLAERGFACMAIDARGGGNRYGGINRTVEKLGSRGTFAEAMHEFEAAIAHARELGYTGKLTLWGSSYSGGLVFALLAKQPDGVGAGICMSPGAAFGQAGADGSSPAARTRVPVFVTWPNHEFEAAQRLAFETIASAAKVLHVQVPGTHGSAAVRADRNMEGHEAVWDATLAFLERHAR